MRPTIFFILFSLLPGLAYQWVQDDLRPLGISDPVLAYLAGVAPNFLGGLSLTSVLVVILLEFRKRDSFERIRGTAALVALAGLLVWEGVQATGRMTFDWHDIAWTFPGVALGWLAAGIVLRSNRSIEVAASHSKE
jgi:hypothetical protein